MIPGLLNLPRLLPRQWRQWAARGVNDGAQGHSTRVLCDSGGGAAPLDLVPVGLAAGLVGDIAVGDGRHDGGFVRCVVSWGEFLRFAWGWGIFMISALDELFSDLLSGRLALSIQLRESPRLDFDQ